MSGVRWSKEDLARHPKRDLLLGAVPDVPSKPQKPAPTLARPFEQAGEFRFTVPGAPVGKPRMTRRDTWKKRPIVVRYREYCDKVRTAAGKLPDGVYGIEILAYCPMPESWSGKKKTALNGELMQQKPDWDNIAKGICDALFEEDSAIAGGTCWKFWCESSEARAEVCVLYWKE